MAAGYSPKGAAVQANRLLKNASVQAEITGRQEEAARRADVKEDDVIQMLLESYKDAKAANQHGPCVRAAELLGRRLGLFRDRLSVDDDRQALTETNIAKVALLGASGDRVAARLFFRNFMGKVGGDGGFDKPTYSDEEIDTLLSGATTH